MFDRVLNTPLKLDEREQIKSLLKALLDNMFINISALLAEIDSDEAAPKCPVRKLFLIFFWGIHQKTPVQESLLNKFASLQPKRDSSTDVFL